MHFSLIMVGAHDGSKTAATVANACKLGKVLLIEPVPWLFEKLKARYADNPAIILHNAVIAEAAGEADFYAPSVSANEVTAYGDQLGSLNPGHAAAHDPKFAAKLEKIRVEADTFETLLRKFDVQTLGALCTDTEGHDAIILSQFPFHRIRPRQVLFEYKHIDGVNRIGSKFAHLLIRLEELGYGMRILDKENCLAQLDAA